MSRVSRLLADRRGNVAVIFGLMTVPVIFMAGGGYDYARASRQRIKLQAAVDGTALALCQAPLTATSSQLETQAKTLIASYMPEGATLVTPLPITPNPRKIMVTAQASSPTSFTGIMGLKQMNIRASAQCASPMPQVFEIALVLDTTGSMARSDGSTSKLASAQNAAKQFIDVIANNDAFDKRTRISVVPFASGVAVDPTAFGASTPWIDGTGKSAYHWKNIDVPGANSTIRTAFKSRLDIFSHLKGSVPSWGWAGCFESLPYPLNTRVDAPTAGNSNSLFVPYFAPDEPGAGTTGATQINSSGSNTYPTSKSGYKNLNPTTQYYGNSYLNDETAASDCGSQTMTAPDAEERACKYRSPTGVSPTTSGALGIPNGPNFGCTSKPLKRLTTSLSSLKSYIDTFQPIGNTNIFEGFMWGWRTLAPTSVFADGSPAGADVERVIILMSDGTNTLSTANGVNFNGSVYTNMGYVKNADGSTMAGTASLPGSLKTNTASPTNDDAARRALDDLTKVACANVNTPRFASIYTVGFSVPGDPIDAEGIALLKSCASSESQAYVVNSGDALVLAFKDIAKSVGKLRLTQ